MKLEMTGGNAPSGHEVCGVSEEFYFLCLSKNTKTVEFSNLILIYSPDNCLQKLRNFIEPGLEDLKGINALLVGKFPAWSNPKHVVYVGLMLSNYATALWLWPMRIMLNRDKFWMEQFSPYGRKRHPSFHSPTQSFSWCWYEIALSCFWLLHGWFVMKDGKMSKPCWNVVLPWNASRTGTRSTPPVPHFHA